MGVVFDEIISEITTPPAISEEGRNRQNETGYAQAHETDAELCQRLDRVNKRQSRLIAD